LLAILNTPHLRAVHLFAPPATAQGPSSGATNLPDFV
jgi:hypothetical protein